MNRLTLHVPTFNSLHLSRSAAGGTVVTNKLRLRGKLNPPLFHRFIRFPHQNAATSRSCNSYSTEEKAGVLPESSRAGSSSPVRGRTLLPGTVVLTCHSSNVFLLGTTHGSETSCREVEAVIRFLKPEVVFLALCSGRKYLLTRHKYFKIAGSELYPGTESEFLVAYEEAKACGARVIFGDRPILVTLQRMWGKTPLWQKAKLLSSELKQKITRIGVPAEGLNRWMNDLSDPTIMETMVHERDQYMACMLNKAAREHSLVVAVVGRAHLPGIEKHWQQPVSIEELMKPYRKPVLMKTITSIGVVAVGVAIVTGIFLSR